MSFFIETPQATVHTPSVFTVPIAEASDYPPPLSLEERASAVALEYGISTTTFFNLIESESQWNPNAYNKKTGDRGLFQISERWHPEVTDVCAYNPDCSMRWAAQRIKGGYIHEWVAANCYAYVSLFVDVPLMNKIVPNSPPFEGAVAIFQYKEKHVAYVEKVEEKGFWIKEANYHPAKIGKRFIKWDDPKLVGFHDIAKSY